MTIEGPNYVIYYDGSQKRIISSETPLYQLSPKSYITTNIGKNGESEFSDWVNKNEVGRLWISKIEAKDNYIIYHGAHSTYQSFKIMLNKDNEPLLVCVDCKSYPVVKFR